MPWSYLPYQRMLNNEKESIIEEYLKKYTDFDNDIITYGVATVLRANGKNDFNFLTVGPDKHGDSFSLSTQLQKKLSKDKEYTYFSLPTLKGKHSVTVVINHKEKNCYLLDSQAISYDEAFEQLKKAIDEGPLQGYNIIQPKKPYIRQQDDVVSCGVHTAANIVGIIRKEIDLTTNAGIQKRSPDEVRNLYGLFYQAYQDNKEKRNSERFVPRQRRVIRFALEELVNTFDVALAKFSTTQFTQIIDALKAEQAYENEYNTATRSYLDFFEYLKEKYPDNSIIPLLMKSEVIAASTITDNKVDEKVKLVVPILAAKLGLKLKSKMPIEALAEAPPATTAPQSAEITAPIKAPKPTEERVKTLEELKSEAKENFFKKHGELFKQAKSELFGFFRRTKINHSWDLKKILEHGMAHNNRTRKVCIEMDWLTKKGSLSENAQSLLKIYCRIKL